MLIHILAIGLMLGLLALIGFRTLSPRMIIRLLTGGLLTLNGLVVVTALLVSIMVWLDSPALVQAAPLLQEGPGTESSGGGMNNMALGAALATGLAAIGAGIAVGISGAAAIGAITEKPEVLGRTLIFVGLAEGIAIYGLIISFMILTGGLGGG